MKAWQYAIVAASMLLGWACEANAEAGSLVLHNARVVDPAARTVTRNGYVVVDAEGMISEVGVGDVQGDFAERIDLDGAYLMPGLIDSHAHVTLGPTSAELRDGAPVLSVTYDDAITRHNAARLLAFGITTIRNPGGDAARNVAYRDAVRAGTLAGPEALVSGPVIDRTGIEFVGLADQVSEQRPIEEIVREQAAAGVDLVKFYTGLTEEDLRRGQAAADALGLPTVGHLVVHWGWAAGIGVDSLVHAMPTSPDLLEPEARERYLAGRRPGGFEFFQWWEAADLDSPLIAEMVSTLAEREVHVDATLIVFRNAFWGDRSEIRDRYMEHAHPAMVENWNGMFRFDAGWQPEDYARARAVWPKILRFVRMLHEAGVPLTLGTDQANPFVAPGASLVQEMQLHEEAGIGRWEVLQMATVEAGEILGLETGRIAPGYEADFVVTGSSPADDLSALYEPRLVISNGRRYDPAELRSRD